MLGITIVSDPSARFGELGGRALRVAFESIGGGKECAELWVRRSGVARLFAPYDRFVGARLSKCTHPIRLKNRPI